MNDSHPTPAEPLRPAGTPSAPVLNYDVRKVMPMSRKVLLAATGGAAIVASGALYLAGASQTVTVPGAPPPATTRWVPATQPVQSVSLPGRPPAFVTRWVPATQPNSSGATSDPPVQRSTTRPAPDNTQELP